MHHGCHHAITLAEEQRTRSSSFPCAPTHTTPQPPTQAPPTHTTTTTGTTSTFVWPPPDSKHEARRVLVASPPSPQPASSSISSGFVLLPHGIDLLLTEYLGASQGLYNLACSHRDLAKYLSLVQRLENLSIFRFERLLAWVSSSTRGESAGRQFPRLAHLHLRRSWDERTSYEAKDLAQMLEQGAFPILESMDLSRVGMVNPAFVAVLDALATTRLQTLYIPNYGGEYDTCWLDEVLAALSKLQYLRVVGGDMLDHQGGLGLSCALRTKERYPEWALSVHTLDFIHGEGGGSDFGARRDPRKYRSAARPVGCLAVVPLFAGAARTISAAAFRFLQFGRGLGRGLCVGPNVGGRVSGWGFAGARGIVALCT